MLGAVLLEIMVLDWFQKDLNCYSVFIIGHLAASEGVHKFHFTHQVTRTAQV